MSKIVNMSSLRCWVSFPLYALRQGGFRMWFTQSCGTHEERVVLARVVADAVDVRAVATMALPSPRFSLIRRGTRPGPHRAERSAFPCPHSFPQLSASACLYNTL